MKPKLSKAQGKTPPPGTPKHRQWRKNITAGMRREKIRRRKAGLMTLTEVACETCLPIGSIRRMVDAGDLPVVEAGTRRYVRRTALERWKARTGESAA